MPGAGAAFEAAEAERRAALRRQLGEIEREIAQLHAELARLLTQPSCAAHASARPARAAATEGAANDDVLGRAAAEAGAGIAQLHADDVASGGALGAALRRFDAAPDALRALVRAGAERRARLEAALLSNVGDATGALLQAIADERAERETSEARLLRFAADAATLIRAELDGEREARARSDALRLQLAARLHPRAPDAAPGVVLREYV
jgi:hypothetical protein